LHKLEERGDLASRRIDVGGRIRVVYRVTPKGTKQRSASFAEWSEVVAAVGHILQGGKYEQQPAQSA
jgi:DNA-binding PadR family transcriptional regulator